MGKRDRQAGKRPRDDEDDDDDVAAPTIGGGISEGTITVDFDVNEVAADDAPKLDFLVEHFLPDATLAVDRDDFAAAVIQNGVAASLIVVANDDEDDEGGKQEDEDEDDEDTPATAAKGRRGPAAAADDDSVNGSPADSVYGIVSFVNASKAYGSGSPSFKALGELLQRPEMVLAPGIPIATLIARRAGGDGSSAAVVLFFNERFRNLPPQVVGQVLGHTAEEFRGGLGTKASGGLAVSSIVFMAKVQRIGGAASQKQQTKRRKTEAAAADSSAAAAVPPAASVTASDFAFWRWEDELLFAKRDERIGAELFRFPAQYDGQPEREIPMCLTFGMSPDNFFTAAKAIAAQGERMGTSSGADAAF